MPTIQVNRDAIPAVLETHLAKITALYEDSSVFGLCRCGWSGPHYPFPSDWWDEHPTRVLIRKEIFTHIADVLEKEAAPRIARKPTRRRV